MSLLADDVVDAARRSVLCWLATVGSDGQPHVSPKEIFAVFDTDHVVVAHIASPTTVRNLQTSPKVCLSFIDVFVQKGFKVLGTASFIPPGDPAFAAWSGPLRPLAGPRFPILGVIVVKATAVSPILAPSYRLHPSETTEAGQIASALRAYGVIRPGDEHATD